MPIPPPTTEDLQRDLEKDLKLCERASPPPWELCGEGTPDVHVSRGDLPAACDPILEIEDGGYSAKITARNETDMEFAAAAREGWPATLRLAIEYKRRITEAYHQMVQDGDTGPAAFILIPEGEEEHFGFRT